MGPRIRLWDQELTRGPSFQLPEELWDKIFYLLGQVFDKETKKF
jgi:hypothetical protein